MSDAIIRTCANSKCKTPIVKDDGCNKMWCTKCKRIMCYVCKEDITQAGYDHFQIQNGCPLHDIWGSGRRHEDEALKAHKKAVEDALKENPLLTEKDISVEYPVTVKKHNTILAAPHQYGNVRQLTGMFEPNVPVFIFLLPPIQVLTIPQSKKPKQRSTPNSNVDSNKILDYNNPFNFQNSGEPRKSHSQSSNRCDHNLRHDSKMSLVVLRTTTRCLTVDAVIGTIETTVRRRTTEPMFNLKLMFSKPQTITAIPIAIAITTAIMRIHRHKEFQQHELKTEATIIVQSRVVA